MNGLAQALIKMIKKKEEENPLCELNEKTENGLITILHEVNHNPEVVNEMKTGEDLIRKV